MRTIVARGEGVTEASLPGSPVHLVAFTPLSGTHQAGYVYLSLSLPKQTVFAAANQALLRNLVVLVVVGGLAFGGARVVADLLILRPVNALVAAAKRLGEGDLRARTGLPHGHSELSELAQVFDQMADAIERRQRELETLYALDRVLAGAHRPEDVARMAVEHALPLLGFDAAAAYLLDEKTQALRLFHARELPPAVVVAIEILPVGAGVAGRAVQARRPLALPIDAYPGDLVPSAAAALRAAGFQTLAATPFVAHGRVYGALTLGSRARLEVSEAMLSLLTSVGTQIGVACAQAAERDRLATQERLAALGRLAAGVAHELKNPLSVITGRVALLRGQVETGAVPASERLVRHLTSLEEAEARMRRIMQGLSTYAKPPKPAPQLLRPADLLGATRELVGYQARKGGVTVGVDIAPDLPPVLGDRSQLMQVLLNLATNAIEAMEETGGQLVLRARVDDDPRENATRSVMVEVTDTGPGIPSDELETIWEPFYTTKPEGTGLGLSIVRSLVAEQPGAGIAVHSEPGQGTTFRLTMPAATPSGRPTP
jgi:signal transduction histidine kinase